MYKLNQPHPFSSVIDIVLKFFVGLRKQKKLNHRRLSAVKKGYGDDSAQLNGPCTAQSSKNFLHRIKSCLAELQIAQFNFECTSRPIRQVSLPD